jgi:hypothetical protein
MKLQYLGDSRDAFKWDLLHWICTQSSPNFVHLQFVPMLTANEPWSSDGATPHERFKCRPFIRGFIDGLKEEPRSMRRVEALGSAEPYAPTFDVSVWCPADCISGDLRRGNYWNGLALESLENAVVFLDPDNGFETKSQRGEKWVRHDEAKELLRRLPTSSIAVIYQHRPRRTWNAVFADLAAHLDYAPMVIATFESNLAFLLIGGTDANEERVRAAVKRYALQHGKVRVEVLRGGGK